ncbi:hypothetical protein Ciccas_008901 [Cichlidogyrus casuarinus]|uniref:Uncharacterized protein n=1 Tax=Cichlidogyrus casuarinus TaxID=1844966 RepID=A0ABD2PZ05_9PLAT
MERYSSQLNTPQHNQYTPRCMSSTSSPSSASNYPLYAQQLINMNVAHSTANKQLLVNSQPQNGSSQMANHDMRYYAMQFLNRHSAEMNQKPQPQFPPGP